MIEFMLIFLFIPECSLRFTVCRNLESSLGNKKKVKETKVQTLQFLCFVSLNIYSELERNKFMLVLRLTIVHLWCLKLCDNQFFLNRTKTTIFVGRHFRNDPTDLSRAFHGKKCSDGWQATGKFTLINCKIDFPLKWLLFS